MDTLRVAIAAGRYRNPRGTQINFHVDNLFGSNTVVLAGDRGEPCPHDKPCFFYYEPPAGQPSTTQKLLDTTERLGNIAKYRSNKVPRGQIKEAMIAFLKDQKVDAILSEFGNISPRLAPIAHEAGIPMFTYFRGIDASAHLRNRLRLSSYRKAVPNLVGVFAVSQFLLNNLAAVGVRHPNSFVVPSGVDTDLFRPLEKAPLTCLAVGRLIEKKRPDITIRAFLKATRNMPDARLEIIGPGALDAQCREIIAASGTPEKVIMRGAQSHDVVRDRLGASEVFLQHSVTGSNGDTEGLPTSIQEAMSCGAIVVSTRHAGIPEAVEEGRTGFLVDEGDEAGFAKVIEMALCLDPKAKSEMAAAARQKAIDDLDNRKLVRFVERKMLELVRANAAKSQAAR
ncbi:MAG: glycosyltransferase [Paracoccaceae bacterium]